MKRRLEPFAIGLLIVSAPLWYLVFIGALKAVFVVVLTAAALLMLIAPGLAVLEAIEGTRRDSQLPKGLSTDEKHIRFAEYCRCHGFELMADRDGIPHADVPWRSSGDLQRDAPTRVRFEPSVWQGKLKMFPVTHRFKHSGVPGWATETDREIWRLREATTSHSYTSSEIEARVSSLVEEQKGACP